jgi:hypothetical protein
LCELTRRLLFELRDLDISPTPFIAPISGGFINIEFETEQKELEIELNDLQGQWATCLCVEKIPVEKFFETPILLDSQLRVMVVWFLGESDLSQIAA